MRFFIIICCIGCLLTAPVWGDESNNEAKPLKYKLGFSERFRMVNWDNAISLDETTDEGQAFTRHRSSAWGQWFPIKGLELTAKLTNEFRYYFVPTDKDFTFNEVVFDWLYVKYQNTAGLPFTLTVGRQNLILGEGFVVLEGQPFDGSRIFSFNAARLDLELAKNHKATLFYTYQPRIDDILPIINDQEIVLVEQPEEGFGIYYEGILGKSNLQAYYIRKNTLNVDYMMPDPTSEEEYLVPAVNPASQINTVGMRFQHEIMPKLSGTVEAAYQFGKRKVFHQIPVPTYTFYIADYDRSAIGGHTHFDYKTGWPWYAPSQLTAGAVYLSGDDPDDKSFGAWDPVFGRWPKWSESYIYTQIREDGVAWWTNLVSINGRALFTLMPDLTFNFDYHKLYAAQALPKSASQGGSGKTRGDLVIGKLVFRLNKYVTGHILWEGFWPGDFYSSEADGYSWTRIEFFFSI